MDLVGEFAITPAAVSSAQFREERKQQGKEISGWKHERIEY
jgi:hypothetical protein